MLLWTLIALLTATAILAVLLPLGRAPAAADPAAHARQVYRDQLAELERDKAEGRLSAAEAESARAEVARRILALEGEASGPATAGDPFARRAVAVVALVGIPLVSLALYLGLGAPDMPGMPLAARMEAAPTPGDTEGLIAHVEAHLAQNPDDGRGWEVLAPIYLRIGRADDAARAMRNVIRLLGSTVERQTLLGEALWMASGGIVTADAREAFEAALAFDPQTPLPRFVLALADKQDGNLEAAEQRLTELLADTPADAPWRGMVVTALIEITGEAPPPPPEASIPAPEVAASEQPGPTAEDVAAAQSMAPDEQAAMIEGMVGRLAARLEGNPDDVEGWLRLIRSYVVLGHEEQAADAARAALDGVTAAADRERVQALLTDLGITPAEATQ